MKTLETRNLLPLPLENEMTSAPVGSSRISQSRCGSANPAYAPGMIPTPFDRRERKADKSCERTDPRGWRSLLRIFPTRAGRGAREKGLCRHARCWNEECARSAKPITTITIMMRITARWPEDPCTHVHSSAKSREPILLSPLKDLTPSSCSGCLRD